MVGSSLPSSSLNQNDQRSPQHGHESELSQNSCARSIARFADVSCTSTYSSTLSSWTNRPPELFCEKQYHFRSTSICCFIVSYLCSSVARCSRFIQKLPIEGRMGGWVATAVQAQQASPASALRRWCAAQSVAVSRPPAAPWRV